MSRQPPVTVLRRRQSQALLEDKTWQATGLTIAEFKAAWEAGELDRSRQDVMELALLLGLA